MRSYHKLTKGIKKLERKYPEYTILAVNKKDVVSSEKGSVWFYNNITKLPRIYSYIERQKITKELEYIKEIIDE